MKWRGGIEARIAALKHCFDMDRAHYKGDVGFKRYVGWSVISNNLTRIARTRAARKAQSPAQKPTAQVERAGLNKKQALAKASEERAP
jgi:hypothetical protein